MLGADDEKVKKRYGVGVAQGGSWRNIPITLIDLKFPTRRSGAGKD